MDVFERLREIRERRGITQKVAAQWFKDLRGKSLTEASFGRKEKGKEGGYGPDIIKRLLDETHMDARYVFGQIDDINQADLDLHEPEESKYQREILEAAQKYNKLQEDRKQGDEVLDFVQNEESIYRLCDEVASLSPSQFLRFIDKASSYVDGLKDQERDQKENTG